MRVIVVRHFRTVNNASRRIMGWGDAPPAEDWEEDLRVVDERLRAVGLHFDAFYSSALGRARETARYFANVRGRTDLHGDPAFNEVNYGDFFGRPKQSIEASCPEYKKDAGFVFPGGESFHEMQRRSVGGLLGLEALHHGRTLLLVAHAGVIRGLVCHCTGLDLEPHLRRKVSHQYVGDFSIENGVCIRYDELGRPSGFVRDRVVKVPFLRHP